MESLSTRPIVKHIYFQEGAVAEALVDCGPFRYHLLVQHNDAQDDCVENTLLRSLYVALDAEDHSAIDAARYACLDLVQPFMFHDYAKRVATNQKSSGTIKIRAKTMEGVVGATDHHRHLKYPPTEPIKNEYPDVDTVSSADVQTLEEIDSDILKVKVGTEIYCLKSVHRNPHESSFDREIKMLRACSHPNIIHLVCLVTDKDSKVEAMLLEYIPNARQLSEIESLSRAQYVQWTEEIQNAIQYLHYNDLVWGDAKPGNVLIRDNNSVVLIDFEGGYTEGWVDSAISGTREGDLQGCERIVQYLEAKLDVK